MELTRMQPSMYIQAQNNKLWNSAMKARELDVNPAEAEPRARIERSKLQRIWRAFLNLFEEEDVEKLTEGEKEEREWWKAMR